VVAHLHGALGGHEVQREVQGWYFAPFTSRENLTKFNCFRYLAHSWGWPGVCYCMGMNRSPAALVLLALLGLGTMVGCAAPESETEVSNEDVVDGRETFAKPEIGALLRGSAVCTATLVRPNVVITAMHCTGAGRDVAVSDFSFIVRKSATEAMRYRIDRSFAIATAAERSAGVAVYHERDIALMRLTVPVSAEWAKPASIANGQPWPGAKVAIFGYGCTGRNADAAKREGTGSKRTRAYTWTLGLAFGFSDTSDVCQGDSGGPLMNTGRNEVFGINSGFMVATGEDFYADVPKYAELLNAQADAWSEK
jgi:V8-like Glu-specific endopeptidase